MGWLAERLERTARRNEGLVFLSQPAFDAWAAARKGWQLTASALAFGFLLLALLVLVVVMGPRLLREGRLLWSGVSDEAIVLTSDFRFQSTGRGGRQLYQLDVTYEFMGPDGRHHQGKAHRGDLQTEVDWKPGDRIRIHYDLRHPENSTIDHNLVIDVVALALFLPFLLLVPGAMAGLFLYRYLRWRLG